MGCSLSNKESGLKQFDQIISFTTLNYGGILNSPFEFFSDDKEEEELSQLFRSLIPKYYPDFDEKIFSWKIGKIDQKIQKQRYTPIYSKHVGILDEQNRFVTREEFQKKWDQQFNEALKKSKLEKPPTEEEKSFMRNFDLICYHTFLAHVYKNNDLNEVAKKCKPQQYKKFMNKFFSRSYLDENKKIRKLDERLDEGKAGVIFFQEPTQKLIDHLKSKKTYHIAEGEKDKTIIVVNKQLEMFHEIKSLSQVKDAFKFTNEQISKIQSNKETRTLFCDEIIFVCVHLSSKAEKNKVELAELKEAVRILRERCPTHYIVIGGDVNAFVQREGIVDKNDKTQIQVYPKNKKDITTCKKRTFLQPQFNKANTVAKECKDQFITDMQVIKLQISTINEEQVSDSVFLPTEAHPFDHFIIYAELRRKQRK